MQTLNYKYILLGFPGTATTFGSVFFSAILVAWIGFFLLGQLVTLKLLPRWDLAPADDHPLRLAIILFAGVWATTSITLLLGLTGLFGLIPVAIGGIATLAATRWYRLPWIPKERPDLALGAAVGLFALVGAAHPVPWPDENFAIAGGHLARTGLFLPAYSGAQSGMAAITALVNIFFGIMSPLTAVAGWGVFFAPLLILGARALISEAMVSDRWRSIGYLILVFPIAFKVQEIRGAIAGFGFVLWGIVFFLRYRKQAARVDLMAIALSFALAWRFGPVASLFGMLFVALIGVTSLMSSDRKQAQHALAALFWTALLSWPELLLASIAVFSNSQWRFLSWLPGTVLVALPAMFARVLEQLPDRKLPRRPLFGFAAAIILAAWAYFSNPSTAPKYNWFLFKEKASFPFLNFGSLGIYGWLFAAGLCLAIAERAQGRKSQTITVLGAAFSTSAVVQILCPWLLRSGLNPFGERALIWDLWKDSTLYWNNGFNLVAIAYLLHRLTEFRPNIGKLLTGKRLHAIVLAAAVLVVPNWQTYGKLLRGRGLDEAFRVSLMPHIDNTWRGQQFYSMPMYLVHAFDLVKQESVGDSMQREACVFCTVHKHASIRGLKPLIDFLLDVPAQAEESFISGESVMTYEPYLNRQIRYASGVNTVSPRYFLYLNDATTYEYYWKPWKKIRRTSEGIAYTVTQPERNIRWLAMQSESSGATLVATFEVPSDGDYELYRGDEFRPHKTQLSLNGQPVASVTDSPAIPLLGLKAGHRYQVRLTPLPGQGLLDSTIPVAVYPHRYWAYERQLFENGVQAAYQLPLMRYTGLISAPMTVDEMFALMTTQDPVQRGAVLDRHHVATIILDPLLQALFPNADRLLTADPRLTRLLVNGLPIFRTAP